MWLHHSRYDFDETWGYRHASVVGETGSVCSWEKVMAGTNDMPTCRIETCGGHNEDDLLPFTVEVCTKAIRGVTNDTATGEQVAGGFDRAIFMRPSMLPCILGYVRQSIRQTLASASSWQASKSGLTLHIRASN